MTDILLSIIGALLIYIWQLRIEIASLEKKLESYRDL